MRCLGRLYDKAGDCVVCHMKLKPYTPPKLLGYSCPLHRSEKIFDKAGPCPFCGLMLKEHYDGFKAHPASSGLAQWPSLMGRTAVYFRPYEVREIGVEKLLRGAGPLAGLHLSLRLPPAESRLVRPGMSAMVMPPQGFARPVQAVVESVNWGRAGLLLSRPLAGAQWALGEIRVELPRGLAVPLASLSEVSGTSKVFVMQGEAFEPRPVTVTARGESYALVQGLEQGQVVAGAGTFWLDAQWRMDHP